MSRSTRLSNGIVTLQAELLARALDDGYLRIYTGTQPTTANTAVSTQTLLVEFRFDDPSAPTAVDGLITFAALASAVAIATGTATWFRALADDGTSVVLDGSVGVEADTPNLTLNAVAIGIGATVEITGFTHAVAKAASGF